MDTNIFSSLARVSNDELLAQVKHLAAREQEATAGLVARLAEVDARRLHLGEGCSSLYAYCTRVLHLSEHAAYGRIEAARAARKYPVILEMLARGDVNLTTVTLLGPILTPGNHRALLEEARFKTRRQVEEIVAREQPRPPVPTSIRKLPGTRLTEEPAERPMPLPAAGVETARVGAETPAVETPAKGLLPAPDSGQVTPFDAAVTARRAAPRAVITPLAPERYRVQFTASAETYQKLARARDLLRHRIPTGDPAAIIDHALTVLLRQLEKQKFAATDRPRASRATARGSRHVPAAVKREVLLRDGERCAYVGRDGLRCGESGFLEIDHVHPHADGGPSSVENLRIACRAHNQYAAELYFDPPEVHESPAYYSTGPSIGEFVDRRQPTGFEWDIRARVCEIWNNPVRTELLGSGSLCGFGPSCWGAGVCAGSDRVAWGARVREPGTTRFGTGRGWDCQFADR